MIKSLHVDRRFPIYWFLAFVLIAIVANRGDTPDTFVYWHIFKHIDWYNVRSVSEFYSVTGVEIGYGWYAYIMSQFTDSKFLFFAIFSFLNFFVLYLILIKFDRKITFLSLLLYGSGPFYFMQQFMQMRQGLSVLLAFYAILLLLKDRKYIPFFIFSLFAFSMHQVSISLVFLALLYNLFLSRFSIQKKQFIYFSTLYLIITVLVFKFFLVKYLMNFSTRLEDYYYSSYNYSVGIFSLPNLKSYLLYIFILIFSKKEMYDNKYFIFLMFLLVTSVASRIGFSDFAILSGRFSTVFGFSEVFLFPLVLYYYFKEKWIVYVLMILIALIQVFVTLNYQAPYLITDYFRGLNL